MADPKISVLIPMYNRKHYISDAIDSVLNQTFQDFEIIIRDNCSTDGSFEFVRDKYAAEISSGRIKLIRNFKNLGEYANVARLFASAQSEYVHVLHSDDFMLPHALEHLYYVAKETNADVVHSSFRYIFEDNSGSNKELHLNRIDNTVYNGIAIMPDDQIFRFREWYERGTFIDIQYNFFSRKFIIDNEIFYPLLFGEMDPFNLWWLMKARIFVKTPMAYYSYRLMAPDSVSVLDKEKGPQFINRKISRIMAYTRNMDKFIPDVALFKNESFRRCVKIWFLFNIEQAIISSANIYRDGISSELYEAVEGAFRKNFGDGGEYPMFLFHLLHSSQCGQNILQAMLQTALDSVDNPAPPQ